MKGITTFGISNRTIYLEDQPMTDKWLITNGDPKCSRPGVAGALPNGLSLHSITYKWGMILTLYKNGMILQVALPIGVKFSRPLLVYDLETGVC